MNLIKLAHPYFFAPFLLIFIVFILSFNVIAQNKTEAVIKIFNWGTWGPSYDVEIYEDGTAVFNGRGHGITNGVRKYKIPQTKVVELIAEFDRSNFFSLSDNYPSNIEDAGAIIIAFSHDGKRKTVSSEVHLKEFDKLASKILDAANIGRFFDQKVRTDNSLTALSNDPAAKLVITIDGNAKETAKVEARIKAHIKFRGYDMKRIKILRRIGNRRINIEYKLIRPDME